MDVAEVPDRSDEGTGDGTSHAARPRVARAAVAAAALWAVVGAGLSFLASKAPDPHALIPQLLVLAVWLVGWPIVRTAGRRYDIQRRGDWLRLWALTIGLIWLSLGVVGCVTALAVYG